MKVNQFSYKAPDEETLRQMEEYYYDNHSIRDVAKKFNTTEMKIRVLRDKGLVRMERTPEQQKVFRELKSKGRKHSEETKKKLSLIRKKWISENPDKSPYVLSHKSRGETYPEKYFREWMEKENIPFQQEYKFKLYSFDFLVNERVDLEIDGGQHKNDKRVIEHDIKRDTKSQEAGFIVYRIEWCNYQRLTHEEKEKFLMELKEFLLNVDSPVPEFVTKKKTRIHKPRTIKLQQPSIFVQHKIKEDLYCYDYRELMAVEMFVSGKFFSEICDLFCISHSTLSRWIDNSGREKVMNERVIVKSPRVYKKKSPKLSKIKQEDPRRKEALSLLKQGMSYVQVGKKFKVSDNAIRKWVKSLGLDPKHFGRDGKKNKVFNLS